MAIIVPAILESEQSRFRERITEIKSFSNLQRMQVDFSDGKFTPFKTVPSSEIKTLPDITLWEAHLMLENPQKYFEDLKSIGFKTIIVHFEAVEDKELVKIAEELRKMDLLPGLAINPQTPIAAVLPYLRYFDQVTLLTVVPGQQGQHIDKNAVNRVKELIEIRTVTDSTILIEIDGGVHEKNLSDFLEIGIDYIVVGSAIFNNDNGLSADRNFATLQKQASA